MCPREKGEEGGESTTRDLVTEGRPREQRKLSTANSMPTCGEYTMRAQPRRRAEDVKGQEPVFLRKTFKMICACDADEPDLACWTPKGETFVVKNPDVFSNVVIPRFFKREPVLLSAPVAVWGESTRQSILVHSLKTACLRSVIVAHEQAAAVVPSHLLTTAPWV